MADSMEPRKMLWRRPLLPWQRNFEKCWLFFHKIVYNSACMAHRPETFGPTRGFSGMADSMEPCKMLLGRPLLPWQRNLGQARRSSRLPACPSVCHDPSNRFFFFCFSMESNHFLAVISTCGTLQKFVLRFLICCHCNEIWAIFAKK